MVKDGNEEIDEGFDLVGGVYKVQLKQNHLGGLICGFMNRKGGTHISKSVRWRMKWETSAMGRPERTHRTPMGWKERKHTEKNALVEERR